MGVQTRLGACIITSVMHKLGNVIVHIVQKSLIHKDTKLAVVLLVFGKVGFYTNYFRTKYPTPCGKRTKMATDIHSVD